MSRQFQRMRTHGLVAINLALCFTMLGPFIGLTSALVDTVVFLLNYPLRRAAR